MEEGCGAWSRTRGVCERASEAPIARVLSPPPRELEKHLLALHLERHLLARQEERVHEERERGARFQTAAVAPAVVTLQLAGRGSIPVRGLIQSVSFVSRPAGPGRVGSGRVVPADE